MKRLFSIFLMVAMMATPLVTCAADLGVQIIGDNATSDVSSFDDIIVDSPIEIPDYAIITPVGFVWKDIDNESRYKSARLSFTILNITGKPIEYTGDSSVRVVFMDNIVFDKDTFPEYSNHHWNGVRQGDMNRDSLIDRDKHYAIGPYDVGYYPCYVFLPNAVIESKEPLRMEVTFGEIELTYHIRK